MRANRKFLNIVGQSHLMRVLYTLLTVSLLLGPGGMAVTPVAQAAANPAPAPAAQTRVFMPLVMQTGVTPVTGSAMELIQAALDAGQIDYPTSLIYRGYAMYADPRLPINLRGAWSDEDLDIFADIEAALPGLTPAQQAALNGFLVRPDNPASAHPGTPPAPPAGLTTLAAAPASAATVAAFKCTPIDEEGRAWGTLASQTIPVRVHSVCYNNAALDAKLIIPLAQLTLTTLESLWGPMTTFMGVTPLRDGAVADDGGDDFIDFYLLYDDEVYPRGDPPVAFGGTELGFARPLKPRQGVAAPGLVGLRRSLAPEANGDTRAYRVTLAHELFHLLQYARNEQFIYRDHASYWFVEASASWAGWNFVPDARPLPHDRFFGFQDSPLSLNITGPKGSEAQQHAYLAYIWPFFMHQQVNSFTISQAWQNIAGVNSWETADQALNTQVNFDNNFPKFALRNLNNKARFGAAIDGHYVDFDPTFPDWQAQPVIEVDRLVVPGDSQAETVTLPNLKAKYFHYTVDPDVQRLQVDVSDFDSTHFKAQMLAKIRGQGWRVIALPQGGASEFCMDNPAQDIEEFYLILSNSDMVVGNTLTGTYEIADLAQPCECHDFSPIQAFTGTISFDWVRAAENHQYRIQVSQFANLAFTMLVDNSSPGGISYLGFLDGTAGLNDSETFKSNPPSTVTISGSGHPENGTSVYDFSHAYLNFKYDDCSYNFGTVVYVRASNGSSAITSLVGAVRSGDRPVPGMPAELVGSQNFRVHSEDWGLENYGDAYFPGGFGPSLFDRGLVSEDTAGQVLVTWHLTPVVAP